MKRTYTKVGKDYTKEEIDIAIKQIKYVPFRRNNLPFCQGESIKAVISQCNVPLSKIRNMSLHGVIKNRHGFYALEVDYSNGKAFLYITDNGCNSCVVASDFLEKQVLTK